MYSTPWRTRLARLWSRRRSPAVQASRPQAFRPAVLPLEDRLLLSTYTVTNTLDTGPGSLRQAIQDSNSNAGPNVIDFNIGSGGLTISPQSALPNITTPVTIDGTSQPGFTGKPLIVLTGTSAGASASGLTISAGHSTVKGLVINGFTQDGVDLVGAGSNVLEGNYIGTDATGSSSVANGTGVVISGSNNLIGGTTLAARNVISGNDSGIDIASGSFNQIEGNYIGTDVTGKQRLQNLTGIEIDSSNNTVGGTTAGSENLISGNGNFGVRIFQATGNSVEGNYIGSDLTGTIALGSGTGVFIYGSNNTVGGTTAGARNVISGNENGIAIGTGNGNVIEGNYIGTDSKGGKGLGNYQDGVYVHGSNNIIGGTTASAANTIAYYGYDGVLVDGGTGNAIRRDAIFSWNSHLSIELYDNGNDNQAAPVITSAASYGGTTTIHGTLTSIAGLTFTLEFFAFAWPNPTSQPLLGTRTVTTDASGIANFTALFNTPVPAGHYVRATATAPNNDTSAFSTSVQVTGSTGPTGSFGPAADPAITTAVVPNSTLDAGAVPATSPVAAMPAASASPMLAVDAVDRVFHSPSAHDAGPWAASWDDGLGGAALSFAGSEALSS